MTHGERTRAACLKSAFEDQGDNYAFQAGYMGDAIKVAIRQIEQGFTGFALDTLKTAQERMGL